MSAFANTKNLPSLLYKRAALISLPDDMAQEYVKLYLHIRKHNGTEYAVDKAKVFKQIVINYCADNNTKLPKDVWAKKRNQHILKGIVGRLQLYANSSSSCLQRVLRLMNLYTVETQQVTTQKSIDKFRSTVEGSYSGKDLSHYTNLLSGMELKRGLRQILPKEDYLALLVRDIHPCGEFFASRSKKPHHEKYLMYDAHCFLSSKAGIAIRDQYGQLFQNIFYPTATLPMDTVSIGTIHRIASPGLKDRWVLDFNKLLEHVLHPFGKRVYKLVSLLPWDITFQEERCFAPIQEHLAAGKTAYAFDLTAATDRFPWTLQRSLLLSLFKPKLMQQSIKMLDELIGLPAVMPDGSSITWKVGQPLGSYPSFGIFTLTHGCLLYALNNYSYSGEFFVHGDDLVVLDQELAAKYKQFLDDAGVDFSPFKTLVSNKYTEINSKVISSDRVATIPKWKPISPKNALDMARQWGMGILKFLYKGQKLELAEKAARMPFPIGAGLNPQGLSLEDRLDGHEELFIQDDKNLSYALSSRSQILKRFETAAEHNAGQLDPHYLQMLLGLLEKCEEADKATHEKYYSVFPLHSFSVEEQIDLLGENLYSVNPDLDLNLRTPKVSEHTQARAQRIDQLIKKLMN